MLHYHKHRQDLLNPGHSGCAFLSLPALGFALLATGICSKLL